MTDAFGAIHDDLAAFADDDEDIELDPDGSFLLVRNGTDIEGVIRNDENGNLLVDFDGATASYRSFLTRTLARLDIFAERLLAKRTAPSAFVDSHAHLDAALADNRDGSALELLRQQSVSTSPFTTNVVFITADAGHGKTVLLRQHQYEQAEAYIRGKTSSLFWHVDLQGRQLVRLSEALMGDLGDLRMTGLWMPAIIKLMQQHAIVLAIDGFDELAAEQGSTDALGALAVLVRQLNGKGTVVAASRRTFFDTEDYVARSGLVQRAMAARCEFNQISLAPWTKLNVLDYFGHYSDSGGSITEPTKTYTELLSALGGDQRHPMLTRPFLVSQLARAFVRFGVTPLEFVRGMDDPLKGVAAVVEAFVKREVEQKWIDRESGLPYLTIEQHMELLSSVAEEMYQGQKDRLDLEVVETIASLLLETWVIQTQNRAKIIEMIRMHVLLTIPPDGDARSRAFDHAEFRDYFVAHALRGLLTKVSLGGDSAGLHHFLRVGQLSDSTARYVCGMLDLDEARTRTLIEGLEGLVAREWKPSILHTNVGTLFPYVLDGREFDPKITFEGRAVFSSVIFEGKVLRGVHISNGTFLNVSFAGTQMEDVVFERCSFADPTIDAVTTSANAELRDCEISGVSFRLRSDEIAREFAPERVRAALEAVGFSFSDVASAELPLPIVAESGFHKLVHRFLRMYQRTTIVNETSLQSRFHADLNIVVGEIVPLMIDHGILKVDTWRGSGSQDVWSLSCSLDELLAGDEAIPSGRFGSFWQAVAVHG